MIAKNWKLALQDKSFRSEVILTGTLLPLGVLLFSRLLWIVESRPGVTIPDPFLEKFVPVDITWITFSVIYAGLILAVLTMLKHPKEMVMGVQSYVLLLLLRFAAMYLLPLEPPAHMIRLEDPFVKLFFDGHTPVKDLFFSGHTSTMFMFYLTSKEPRFRSLFLAATVIIAICVILQNVHYSIDVFAAPFFCYGAVRLIWSFHKFRNS